jgi:hypothetical protein
VIEIAIDELIVRGLAPEAAREMSAALEERLATLAEAAPSRVPARAEAFRRAAPVSAPAGSSTALGHAVAESVWSAVSGGRR